MSDAIQRVDTAHRPSCLILEDQALIAFELAAMLEGAGIPVAGPFATCAEAQTWIAQKPPALAVLDFRLSDGDCIELVNALRALSVPVIIYSGWPQEIGSSSGLRDVTWLEKPTDEAEILATMAELAPSLFETAPS